jgi:hypothetical protein
MSRTHDRTKRISSEELAGGSYTHAPGQGGSLQIDRGVLVLQGEDPDQSPGARALLTETSMGSMDSRLNRVVRQGKREAPHHDGQEGAAGPH